MNSGCLICKHFRIRNEKADYSHDSYHVNFICGKTGSNMELILEGGLCDIDDVRAGDDYLLVESVYKLEGQND